MLNKCENQSQCEIISHTRYLVIQPHVLRYYASAYNVFMQIGLMLITVWMMVRIPRVSGSAKWKQVSALGVEITPLASVGDKNKEGKGEGEAEEVEEEEKDGEEEKKGKSVMKLRTLPTYLEKKQRESSGNVSYFLPEGRTATTCY